MMCQKIGHTQDCLPADLLVTYTCPENMKPDAGTCSPGPETDEWCCYLGDLWMKTINFGVQCKVCEKACLVPISREMQDVEPAEILKSLEREDQLAITNFFCTHQNLGHKVDPVVVEIEPMAKT